MKVKYLGSALTFQNNAVSAKSTFLTDYRTNIHYGFRQMLCIYKYTYSFIFNKNIILSWIIISFILHINHEFYGSHIQWIIYQMSLWT